MSPDEIRKYFPHASASVLRANLGTAAGLHPAEHSQPAVALAQGRQGKAPRRGCPVVRFEISRHRLLDVDAKYAAVKHLLDGIVATGIVAGDKEGQIELEVIQQKASKNEAETTVIKVFENT